MSGGGEGKKKTGGTARHCLCFKFFSNGACIGSIDSWGERCMVAMLFKVTKLHLVVSLGCVWSLQLGYGVISLLAD
jgi:hypothetical protein